MKNLTHVHHSFLHQNNSPANHVARFVSRAGRTVSVLEYSCAQLHARNLYQIDRHTCKFLVVVSNRRLAQVSGTSFLSVCRRHKGAFRRYRAPRHPALPSGAVRCVNASLACCLRVSSIRHVWCGLWLLTAVDSARCQAHAAGASDIPLEGGSGGSGFV